MTNLSWDSNSYFLDGAPGFLVSGEFHYFRVPKADWARRLDLLKEAGASCVATYIPWGLHEPSEGLFRFSDGPETDLEGFLDLCREKELNVIARPGPYQYSEMRYCGLPRWLMKEHPEIYSRKEDGTPHGSCSVTYLHPVFLEKTKKWFDAVLPILARHQKSRGGAVSFVQLDNELSGIHVWFGGWDYHPDVMLPRFAEFQKKRPAAPYRDFYMAAMAEYMDILAGWVRGAGIGCALLHNGGNAGMVCYFRETVEKLGADFLLGMDLYYNLGMDWDTNNPTPKLATTAFFGHECLRLMGFPSGVFEMQAGNCADWPPITGVDLSCWYMTNLALGMKGVNYYVFAGGKNPANLGGDGDNYDYCAPIGADGEIRETYRALKEFGGFMRDNSWLAGAEMEHDYLIGLDWDHARGKDDAGGKEAYGLLIRGMMITGLCSGRTPKLADLEKELPQEPLFVPAARQMSRKIQENLVSFLKSGGRLMIAPILPCLDENGEACTILRDYLGAGPCEKVAEEFDFHFKQLRNIVGNSLWACQPPEGAEALGHDAFSGKTAAWKAATQGGGTAVWLGLDWKYAKKIHSLMYNEVMEELSAGPAVLRCDNPNVWAFSRTDGKRRMIFALNLFTSPQNARLTTREGKEYEARVNPMSVLTIDTDLK